ncbi:phosphotransferase [Mycolicibacterium fortuitum]|uniref:Phosphotransferase n=1 Tax=Mycolicibacterium fortuitum TaxID=1766 RepID=A0AAE4V770_MYCFO|nr:phosphotransferase [Mycolicibacterium fortuitum]MDV7189069.1 phosphotransferase [Mycolicibacterium fortuitum]MDV7203545.1 phosphotransferase [Mycolicibacterium fortuitum]MDV7228711.1 phosphotransferase [Mycolicibacterium fortuitum]MDV7256272.1 phosphotransferase [Mycolicibacterium fortuitum]MDV7282122.1 phosphotransferase [Mycolicibacterium fortuitum]
MVEDDQEQIYFNRAVLSERGFDVRVFENYDAVMEAVDGVKRPVDLVVLDRRLPRSATDEPTDQTGDDLLNVLLDKLPDTPFIVFTGHTDFVHAQFTLNRGVISVGPDGEHIVRVYPFEKEQTLEFGRYIDELRDHLDRLSDIHVDGVIGDDQSTKISRRLLRCVARHFGGASILAVPLTGGLGGKPVWWCQVVDRQGRTIASIVVKQSDRIPATTTGGLRSLLPARFVAASVASIGGLCDARIAQVTQLAGSEPRPLLDLILSDDQLASSGLAQITQAMRSALHGAAVTQTLEELMRPLIAWTKARDLLAGEGIACPRATLGAPTTIVAQHGDLHPGNILLVDGSPILIDFDDEKMASRLLDPVTALLSPLFHRASPIRDGEWPTLDQCRALGSGRFLDGCPIPEWVGVCQDWLAHAATSDREMWSIVLGYAARQLKYPDVISSTVAKGHAIALATAAVEFFSADE